MPTDDLPIPAAAPPAEPLWPWPDSLDALMAAPAHHTLLLENEHVRVVQTRIAPGDSTPLHTHRWPGATYLQSWSHFVRRDQTGAILLDTRTATSPPPSLAATAAWLAPLPPHTVENVGDDVLLVISVELKGMG